MNLIAFYISDHGYGHAARNIPIIQSLLKQNASLKIIIKTSINLINFMKQSLKSSSLRIAYYELNTDLGLILKSGSMSVDKIQLYDKLIEFIDSWDEKIDYERRFLLETKVDLVISDITPWVFKSCKLANVKSVFISNFTWTEIYEDIFGSNDIYMKYKECYSLASFALIYPLAGNIEKYFTCVKRIGMSCRKFSSQEKLKIIKKYQKPIVYVSVGRSVNLENGINLEGLPFYFIFTEGIKIVGSNTELIEIDTPNTQDYILASDYIITKAGWGTIAEAICAKKPMLVIERNEVQEDRTTLQELVKLDIAIPIKVEELNREDIERMLESLKYKKENYKLLSNQYNDCSYEISSEILRLL